MKHPGAVHRPPLLRLVDAVTIPVPDLDLGLGFYRDRLGHELLWRNDPIGKAGLRIPNGDTEIVLSTTDTYAPNWLVTSVEEAATVMMEAGGRVILEPMSIPVGRLAVVADPFDNPLVLLDLSTGRYVTDRTAHVTGVQPTDRS
jgi:predicted enzyme related to lactoylglutathione lyase